MRRVEVVFIDDVILCTRRQGLKIVRTHPKTVTHKAGPTYEQNQSPFLSVPLRPVHISVSHRSVASNAGASHLHESVTWMNSKSSVSCGGLNIAAAGWSAHSWQRRGRVRTAKCVLRRSAADASGGRGWLLTRALQSAAGPRRRHCRRRRRQAVPQRAAPVQADIRACRRYRPTAMRLRLYSVRPRVPATSHAQAPRHTRKTLIDGGHVYRVQARRMNLAPRSQPSIRGSYRARTGLARGSDGVPWCASTGQRRALQRHCSGGPRASGSSCSSERFPRAG